MPNKPKLKFLDFEELSKSFLPDCNPAGCKNLDEYYDFLVELESIRPEPIADFSRWFPHIDKDTGNKTLVEVFYSGVPVMERIIGHEMDNLWFFPRKEGQDGMGVP